MCGAMGRGYQPSYDEVWFAGEQVLPIQELAMRFGELRGLEGYGQIPNDEDNTGMDTNRYALDALEIFQLL
jgi:hypothetical protein